MNSRRREPPAALLPRPTRPCPTCGWPIPVERLPTAALPLFGWHPYQTGTLRPPCGHLQVVVPYPAPGAPGWWVFIPLVGTGPVLRPSTTPAPRSDGFDFWVTAPGEEAYIEQDAELRAVMASLEAEMARIRSLADPEACWLCGVRAALTKEHAPSQASGNNGLVFGGRIDEVATHASGTVVWTADEPTPDGATFKTLCAPCNNDTGRRYNPSYVALVAACEPHARPETATRRCQVSMTNRPLVAKQALTWLVASSQSGFTERYPHLRELLQRSSARGPLAPLRLWCYLMANKIGWFTGIAAHVDRLQRSGHLVASFAWWPLGWLLTTGDTAVEGAADVSEWVELRKHSTAVSVALPCQWRVTPYPIDFRGPDEVRHDSLPGHQWRGRP